MTEEERAVEYRRQQRSQSASRRRQLVDLAGSRTAAKQLRDAWKPVLLWSKERNRRGD